MLTKIAAAAAIMLATATHPAGALEGYDSDNNPVPAAAYGTSVARNAFASTGGRASALQSRSVQTRDGKGADPNAVYLRGRYLGSDPDPNVRLRIMREAIGG